MSKKVLLVSNNGPEPSFGGGQRNILIGKLFESLGFTVEMVLLINMEWGQYDENSNLFNEWNKRFKIIKLFQPSFKLQYFPDLDITKYLKQIQNDYDWIIFRYEIVAFKSGFYLLKKNKIIVDFDDFNLPIQNGLKKYLHYFRHLIQYFRIQRAFILKITEKKYFFQKSIWLPNIPLNELDLSGIFKKRITKYPSIIHICGDIDLLTEFIYSNNFSAFLRRYPDLKIYVIYKGPQAQFESKINIPNVFYIDPKIEIKSIYELCWVSLVLEKKSLGTHIKVIESIYFNTPVVGFKNCIRGYECFNSKDKLILIGDSVGELIIHLRGLFDEKNYYNLIVEEAKKIQEQRYSFKALLSNLKNI